MPSLQNQFAEALLTSTVDVEFKLLSVCETFAAVNDTNGKLRDEAKTGRDQMNYNRQWASA